MIIACNSYKVKNIHFKSETIKLDAKIDSIDSTANYYLYFIKNDTLNAYFSKLKLCTNSYKTNTEIKKIYSLTVKTDATKTYRYKNQGNYYVYVDDTFSNTDESILELVDCLNICGKTIENQ
ncbi:hypothetical protein A0O34_01240 [Chryseobacterium glaciei]|uniref:Uncharacterized protein n=1 Tax=Chryseobacterium glaciei TaxID=1685010 RepID=A0A172XQT2_9FLAO|nr:hypothetical protein A0O34_01240 [Chryseobacterium glaciei]